MHPESVHSVILQALRPSPNQQALVAAAVGPQHRLGDHGRGSGCRAASRCARRSHGPVVPAASRGDAVCGTQIKYDGGTTSVCSSDNCHHHDPMHPSAPTGDQHPRLWCQRLRPGSSGRLHTVGQPESASGPRVYLDGPLSGTLADHSALASITRLCIWLLACCTVQRIASIRAVQIAAEYHYDPTLFSCGGQHSGGLLAAQWIARASRTWTYSQKQVCAPCNFHGERLRGCQQSHSPLPAISKYRPAG